MTAAEVKNSLEICGTQGKWCLGCAFYNTKTTNCVSKLAAATLMLILDQEKKIEELTDKHWSECRQIMHYDNELNSKT